MRLMWWVVAVVAVVALVATYLTWTASRVDRLHRRAAAARTALDAQLDRRAEVASALGSSSLSSSLNATARAVLAARPDDREAVENDLTRQLREHVQGAEEPVDPALEELVAVSRRVALTRQVHNDV